LLRVRPPRGGCVAPTRGGGPVSASPPTTNGAAQIRHSGWKWTRGAATTRLEGEEVRRYGLVSAKLQSLVAVTGGDHELCQAVTGRVPAPLRRRRRFTGRPHRRAQRLRSGLHRRRR